MTVLIVSLKIILWLIAAAVLALVVILALPVSVRASCHLAIESNLEEALGMLEADDPGEITLFFYDGAYELTATVLLGLMAVSVSDRGQPEVRIVGFRVPPGKPPGSVAFRKSGRPDGTCASQTEDTESMPAPGKGDLGRERQASKSWKGKKIHFEKISKYLAPEVRATVIRFIKGLLKAFHLEMDMDVELGFSDPALTGMGFGFLCAFLGAAGVSGVRVNPNFEQPVISVRGAASLRVIPLHVLCLGARFWLAPEIRRFWWKRPKTLGA